MLKKEKNNNNNNNRNVDFQYVCQNGSSNLVHAVFAPVVILDVVRTFRLEKNIRPVVVMVDRCSKALKKKK